MATNTSHLYAQFIFAQQNLEHFNQAIQMLNCIFALRLKYIVANVLAFY